VFFNFTRKFLGLQDLCLRSPAKQPSANLAEVADRHFHDEAAIGLLYQFLGGVPGPLANVGSLNAGESKFNWFGISPDHVECRLLPFIEVKVSPFGKAEVGQLNGTNTLDCEASSSSWLEFGAQSRL